MTATWFKTVVLTLMALITFNLFRGLYFLVTGKGGGKNTARSLTWRIGLSILLFLLLVTLKLTGIVEPHALGEATAPVVTTPADDTKKDEGKTLQDIEQQNDASGGRVRLKN
jgi:hypothetical protein